jgi:hypothetical protein
MVKRQRAHPEGGPTIANQEWVCPTCGVIEQAED